MRAFAVSRVATASRQSTPPPVSISKMSREGTMICPPPLLGRSVCTNHAFPSSAPFDTGAKGTAEDRFDPAPSLKLPEAGYGDFTTRVTPYLWFRWCFRPDGRHQN